MSRKPAKHDHHISPVPDGFLIRVMREGKLTQVFVAKSKGAAHARTMRDALLDGLPKYEFEQNHPIAHVVARSNTGRVGLSYNVQTKGESEYEVSKASVRVRRCAGRGRTFCMSTYGGYDGALAAAQAWRDEMLDARRRKARTK